MNANQKLALAMLAGVAIGAAAIDVLHAQGSSTPPAYVIAEQTITDPDTFKQFAEAFRAPLKAFDGRSLAAGGKTASIFGAPPLPRVAVIAFPSMDAAQKFYASPAYKEIQPLRDRSVSADSRTFIVEGVALPAPAPAVGTSTPPTTK
jgi:uncharacterized protein (DUF1330 family)